MATRNLKVEVTLTEMPQFRRLVDLLDEVERLGDERCDVELQDLVKACREDLVRMG